MKVKDLIGVLSKFPENLEVVTYRERYGSDGLDGFWKDIDVNEERGFFMKMKMVFLNHWIQRKNSLAAILNL